MDCEDWVGWHFLKIKNKLKKLSLENSLASCEWPSVIFRELTAAFVDIQVLASPSTLSPLWWIIFYLSCISSITLFLPSFSLPSYSMLRAVLIIGNKNKNKGSWTCSSPKSHSILEMQCSERETLWEWVKWWRGTGEMAKVSWEGAALASLNRIEFF